MKSVAKYSTKDSFIENPNIGVIDSETFLGKDNIQKIYAIGFKTNLDPKPVIYYIDKDNLDTSKLILSMVNELVTSKYNNITFYCHNLGGYNIIFIISILYNYNDNNEDKYNISPILRDGKIIHIKISKGKKKFYY